MNTFMRCCTTALAAVILAVGLPAADAQAGGRHGGYGGGGGYRNSGPGWGGVGLGLGLGIGLGWLGASRYAYSYGPPVYSGYYGAPGYVVIDQPAVVYREVPPPVVYREVPRTVYREVPIREAAPVSRPDPIIYPRNGQSAQQIEADRQECNRWATTQPSAMSDSSVFNRATEACMDGRGYTLR
ncbi:MAG: hypothetical protein Q7T97_13895 [Burkholderiaceae bacterium]|nr:hypothetical protein [Burkholderiaceae bacterium]